MTINNIGDLIQILQDQPQWAAALRGVLLSRELLELPEEFAKFVQLTNANFELVNTRLERLETGQARLETRMERLETGQARLETRMDGLEEGQARLETRMDGLEEGQARLETKLETRMDGMDGRMDNGFGTNYEIKVERNLMSHAGQHLNLRAVRVLRGTMTGQDAGFNQAIEGAVDDGRISWKDHDELMLCDLIFTGRARGGGEEVHVAAEASITAGDQDVERAQERARILRQVIGQEPIPLVICANIDDQRAQMARERGVAVIRAPM